MLTWLMIAGGAAGPAMAPAASPSPQALPGNDVSPSASSASGLRPPQ